MRYFRTFAVVAAVTVLTATIAPSTMAHATYGRWGTSTVSFYVNPSNADVSQSAAISALQAGMDIWNTQAGTPLRLSYAGQASDTTTGYNNRNVILFRNESSGSTIAATYSWMSNNLLVDSDIIYYDGGVTFFTGSSGCSGGAYIEDIAAHELGHSLGLSHSDLTDATMYYSYATCSQTSRTLSNDDIAGARSLYGTGGSTPDTAPTVTVSSPASGTTVSSGTAVNFSGSASDTPDGDVSGYLTWNSSIQGQIGLGASFSRVLNVGSHTITVTVSDSTGHTTDTAASPRYVTVTAAPNTPPTVSIASPSSGTTVTTGTSVTFSGSASDAQDGSLTSTLVWRSSLDPQFVGTGGTFTKTLTAGTHTITAKSTDSGELIGEKSITITVTASAPVSPPPPGGGPKLTARGYKEKGNQKAALTWSNLTGASVDIYRSNAKIATTPNTGTMTDNIDKKGNGSYTYKVCDASTTTCSNLETVTF